eukprot:Colp12_sorted_trinity150504_noHs@15291
MSAEAALLKARDTLQRERMQLIEALKSRLNVLGNRDVQQKELRDLVDSARDRTAKLTEETTHVVESHIHTINTYLENIARAVEDEDASAETAHTKHAAKCLALEEALKENTKRVCEAVEGLVVLLEEQQTLQNEREVAEYVETMRGQWKQKRHEERLEKSAQAEAMLATEHQSKTFVSKLKEAAEKPYSVMETIAQTSQHRTDSIRRQDKESIMSLLPETYGYVVDVRTRKQKALDDLLEAVDRLNIKFQQESLYLHDTSALVQEVAKKEERIEEINHGVKKLEQQQDYLRKLAHEHCRPDRALPAPDDARASSPDASARLPALLDEIDVRVPAAVEAQIMDSKTHALSGRGGEQHAARALVRFRVKCRVCHAQAPKWP